tara:strand:- start:3347 stop:4186 length:840 start_codon:yes stop_codon:yes gene_type:complete
MQPGIFGGLEGRLKQWLHKQHGEEWCEAHDVQTRTFNDLIHDPEIRPGLQDFNHAALAGLVAAAQHSEDERRDILRDYDDGKEYWGEALPLEEPPDMRPFSAIERLPELQDAVQATINWALEVKDISEDPGTVGEYYPPFLVLNGIPGCGKTMLAKAACHVMWGRRPVLFITEAAMIKLLHQSLARNQVDAVMEELMGIPHLILDDYGAAALTPGSWGHGKRDELLSYRWENDQRTMITTNLKSDEIRADSPRLASRMMDKAKAVNVAIQAADYRQKVR